uniref:Ankyrin repeat domain 45 n=1 Tax=Sphenodon punctatus TaxID=8508 RepID=A0A8D0HQG3_SPHPU
RHLGAGEFREEKMELGELTEPVEPAETTEPEDAGESKEPEYSNPLLRPALSGDVEGVQKIFEDPEDPDHRKAMQLLMERDIVGRDLLYAACVAGQSDVIRALTKYGVDVKAQTVRGYTPLHCAAAWGQLETLKTLVELEADILAMTFRGEKARDIASRYSQTDCVEFLDWAGPILFRALKKSSAILNSNGRSIGSQCRENRNVSLNACRVKSDWLENTKDPTIQDFLEQRQQLEDIMLPVFTKLASPREYWVLPGGRPHMPIIYKC